MRCTSPSEVILLGKSETAEEAALAPGIGPVEQEAAG